MAARAACPPPPTRRGRESRQRILEAARKIFGAKGYHAAAITDITREADIALGAFYRYFPSKKHVFIEILDVQAQMIRQVTVAAMTGATDRLDEEARGLAAFFALVREQPDIYRIAREAEFVDEDAYRRYYHAFFARYSTRITTAMRNGEIRWIDPEALTVSLMGIAHLVGMFWPYWTRKPIPPAVFDGVMDFIRWGMDTRRPESRNGRTASRTRHGRRATR